MVASFVANVPVAVLTTFAAVHTYVTLNEVARDIEDPFFYDPNQLPLPQMQYKMNERLLAVTKTARPSAFTDVEAIGAPTNAPPSVTPAVRLVVHLPPHAASIALSTDMRIVFARRRRESDADVYAL